MKHRFIIALTILAAFVLPADSTVSAERPAVGVKGGLNIAWMTARGAGSKIGFTGGVFARYAITPRWSLQTELLYARQGGDFTSYSEYWDLLLRSSLSLDYLEVPLLVQYTLPIPGRISPALYSGPSLFIALHDNAILETDYGRLDADILNAKTTYWGWVFGSSIGLPTGPAVMTIDVRFTLGMQAFLGESQELVNPESEVNLIGPNGIPLNLKHHSIAVSVGMAF